MTREKRQWEEMRRTLASYDVCIDEEQLGLLAAAFAQEQSAWATFTSEVAKARNAFAEHLAVDEPARVFARKTSRRARGA